MESNEPKVGSGEADEVSASPVSPATSAGETEAPVSPAVPESEGDASEVSENGAAPASEVESDPVEEATRKADEYLALAQRTQADFENFRKRAAREAAAAQQRGIAKLARELLPAIDNLDRALTALEEGGDEGVTAGVRLVHNDVISALARAGVEPFSPTGEPFDPTHHEAVAQQPAEGVEPGTVVEVYQRGYRMGESVLRPARVLVAG